jgi:hypothetical protein
LKWGRRLDGAVEVLLDGWAFYPDMEGRINTPSRGLTALGPHNHVTEKPAPASWKRPIDEAGAR